MTSFDLPVKNGFCSARRSQGRPRPGNPYQDSEHETETKGGSITSEVPITETDDQIPGRKTLELHAILV